MNDFAAPAAVAKDRIFVSWDESWDLDRYVDEYLRAHQCLVDEANFKVVLECIENFPAGRGALTKVNMDFWLESNGLPLTPAPAPAPVPMSRNLDF